MFSPAEEKSWSAARIKTASPDAAFRAAVIADPSAAKEIATIAADRGATFITAAVTSSVTVAVTSSITVAVTDVAIADVADAVMSLPVRVKPRVPAPIPLIVVGVIEQLHCSQGVHGRALSRSNINQERRDKDRHQNKNQD